MPYPCFRARRCASRSPNFSATAINMSHDSTTDSMIREMSLVEGIRKRPAMYVGTTGLFGFVNYLVCPIALLLAHGAKRISVAVGDAFEISSDAPITIQHVEGRIAPFEEIRSTGGGHSFEGTVLNALSSELAVSVMTEHRTEELRFTKGIRTLEQAAETLNVISGTTLRFKPDIDIFTVTQIDSTIFESYFRRLSFLHGGTQFSLTLGSETKTFLSANGITDLFTAISSPYQLMNEPIHISGNHGKLHLELIMAYQSWSDNHLWCFINNGRAVEGGTHEQGLLDALKRLKKKLSLPQHYSNGVVAVASLRYPDAVWEGCIKARIGNPELKAMVSQLVVDETVKWAQKHPNIVAQIQQLQIFQFPDAWYH